MSFPAVESDQSFPRTTYACTFRPSQCSARFDNYASWTQHETKHGQPPLTWYCGEQDHKDDICISAWNCVKDLRKHLRDEHGIAPLAAAEYLDRRCDRIIHQAVQTYWCGFCRQAMEVRYPGEIAFENNRFQHMQDHFLGRSGPKRAIETWVELYNLSEDGSLDKVSGPGSLRVQSSR